MKRSFSIKHFIPLIVLLVFTLILYFLGFSSHFTFENLKAQKNLIFSWIHLHPLLSALTLSCLYIISISLLIPASTVLTLLAGMAYPLPFALVISILSETIGNCLFFIIVKRAFFPFPLEKTNTYFAKAEKHFKKNPSSYLLFLRFSHLTPSWLIALLGAMFKTPLVTFAWTTLIGSIPMCYLVVESGRVLNKSVKAYHNFNWHNFFDTETKLLFLAFGLLSLTPILIRKIMKR